VRKELGVSERRACRVIGQPRSTQRYTKRPVDDEELLIKRIVELASEYGRYTCTCSAVQVWVSARDRHAAP